MPLSLPPTMRAPRSPLLPLAALAVAVLIFVTGCGTSGPAKSRKDPRRISTEELQEARRKGYQNAYELVRNYRPQWLVKRGRNSLNRETPIWVYVNGSQLGAPAALRQVTLLSVTAIRFVSASEASNRYGMDHDNGVIAIETGTR